MDRLFTILADISDARKGGGDTFSDRLSSRYTVFLLIIFSIIVTTRHIVGSPISCWCPPLFTSSQIDYTNKVCWTTNTFYLPVSEEHLIPEENKVEERIGYYQWVALILCCEAVFFYLPRPLWLALSRKSGIEISTLIDAAIECEKSPTNVEQTKSYIINIACKFLQEVSRKHMTAAKCKAIMWKFYGHYLTILYNFFKLVYLFNVIIQLQLLNFFLGTDYSLYGLEMISNIFYKGKWGLSKTFPRVTMCDFKIRIIGNVQRHIVQCTLPINMFNEKIFLVLWFWLVFVAITTTASFILSLFVSLFFF